MLATEMGERLARFRERAARCRYCSPSDLDAFILLLLLVIGTPVALRIADTLKNITFGAPGLH